MTEQEAKSKDGDSSNTDTTNEGATAQTESNSGTVQKAADTSKTVTITMSKRMAQVGAFLLAGFLGFIMGVIGTRVVDHIHHDRDGRGPGHHRKHNDPRMGQGHFGPGNYGPGMMQGDGDQNDRGPGFGPNEQGDPNRPNGQGGPGMMPGGPQGLPTPAPEASEN